jgi:hypothetical protein
MNNIHKTISWIKNRCSFRYKECAQSQTVIFLSILENIFNKIECCDIEKENLDKIIAKYYFDFTFDKITDSESMSSTGFDERDRQILRHNICNIYKDITQYIIQNHDNSVRISQDLTHQFDNEEEILNIISSNLSAQTTE